MKSQAAPAGSAAVDWSCPWLTPYVHLLPEGLPAQWAQADGTAQVLNAAKNAPVRFVAQSAFADGQAYEQFIYDTGTVPTRDNLHDLFNGLCWMVFPYTKQKLNQLQAAEIASAGVQETRGSVRDALTLFDENAAFLQAPQALWDALLARDWRRLFVELRPLWVEARLVLFGHALLEKLAYPRKPITAHVYRAQFAIDSLAITTSITELDAWIAADLSADWLAGKPFAPMPVLGVPGWWPDNENPSFYEDILVFRPPK